ncbi:MULTISPECIES: amidohydrolase family protein [Rhodomicrobium]|uniref:amidohydrolase family protein n=1 Tax=Rhodomicrobium TaxID=1068 RepID=UPI000B4BA253|nr:MULTISPECIES: amidohydrolase family protein [Rhodomicrobium]
MPNFPIIDAHVHLYDPTAIRFSWMDGEPALNRRHGLSEFAAASAGVDVEGIVFVEVAADDGRHLDESHWVEQHAAGVPLLRGIVGALPLELGARAGPALDAFAALPRARGVRRLIQDRPPGWALEADFVDGVRSLSLYDLPFDICIRAGQLAEAIELVRRCPDTRFVLDHIGKPAIRDGQHEPWRTQLRELSRAENVVCKISGVATEADPQRWTYDDVAPFIAHAIDSFGFARVMFGGDWPVSEAAVTYPAWVATVDRVTSGATDTELRQLYRDTAIGFYRL